MKTTSTKWAKLKHRLQREYWKKKHIDAPLPARAKRVLMSLSRCGIDGSPLHVRVVKQKKFYICLDCGRKTWPIRPQANKSFRPRR